MSYTLGIDVSHHNGAIRWDKLRATGKVQFAVIRICHGLTMDRQFAANLTAAKANHVPYAFYWYGENATKAGAQTEAKFALSKVKGTNPLFVAYDAECDSLAALGKNQTTDVAWTACEAIQRAGYKAYIYTNENWRRNEIDVQFLKNKGVGFWYARYTGQAPPTASYASLCDIWQYSCTGKLAGNGSQYIDLDALYDPKLIAKINSTSAGANPSYCDTTMPFFKHVGEFYTFKSASPVTCGTGSVFQKVSESRSDGYYLTKFKAVGRGSAGFYVNGVRKCVGTVV
jgi:Lyzozyme M1 (1,4-beta-N-acetylmuramidase)